ncbi:MAG: hypothetical protein ACOC2Q_00485, partial [Spirochaetota bacterium]
SSPSGGSGGNRTVTLLVVVPGERSSDGSLTLQGRIQAGMVASALADEPVAAILAAESEVCRAMVGPLAARRESVPTRPLPQPSEDPTSFIRSLFADYPGRTLVVAMDEETLRGLLSALDGVAPAERTRAPVSPASITRLRIRPDLSYSARFNDTDHLDLPMGSIGGIDS